MPLSDVLLCPGLPEKFWAKVRKAEPDACWVWQGYVRPRKTSQLDYGIYRWTKQSVAPAHRIAFTLTARSAPPDGMCVMHTCDNPRCCNPAHLKLGTKADNNRDRSQKGRTVRPVRDESTVSYAKGERHGSAKLSSDDAIAICCDARSLAQLATVYGCSRSTIGRIKNGQLWAEETALLRAKLASQTGGGAL